MQITYTLKDLEKVAKQIMKAATSKVLLFDADMGMGKTTLIKAIVRVLGSIDSVSSPTFSLVNEYKTEKHTIYHFDLYRVQNEEELYDFGIEEYLNGPLLSYINELGYVAFGFEGGQHDDISAIVCPLNTAKSCPLRIF